MPKLKPQFNATLKAQLVKYEQVTQAHTSQLTPDHLRVIYAVREWCDWYEHSFGEPLSCAHLSDNETSRSSAARYRAYCLKYGTAESFRRKRERIRRFLRWGIQVGWVTSDPFAVVLPPIKRASLRRANRSRPENSK